MIFLFGFSSGVLAVECSKVSLLMSRQIAGPTLRHGNTLVLLIFLVKRKNLLKHFKIFRKVEKSNYSRSLFLFFKFNLNFDTISMDIRSRRL